MQIIASDFDNTIFFLKDEEKNAKNIAAIRKFIELGNKFIIITGRNYSDLKKDLKKYKTLENIQTDYQLAYSMIADYIEEKVEIYSK